MQSLFLKSRKGFSFFSILVSVLIFNLVILLVSFGLRGILSSSISLYDSIQIINYPLQNINSGKNNITAGFLKKKEFVSTNDNLNIVIMEVKINKTLYYFLDINHLRIPDISNKGK